MNSVIAADGLPPTVFIDRRPRLYHRDLYPTVLFLIWVKQGNKMEKLLEVENLTLRIGRLLALIGLAGCLVCMERSR